MKIGFFYPAYHPLTNGRAVHGFQLTAELQARGHEILSCLGAHQPGTITFPRTYAGALQLARLADVLYIRISSDNLERATLLSLLPGKRLPVVWELNAPADELLESAPDIAAGHCMVRRRVRRWRMLARLVDGAVGVSHPVADYLRRELKITNVCYAPNGSDVDRFDPCAAIPTVLERLPQTFKIMWAGNARTPWQNLELLFAAARQMLTTDPDVVFILLTGDSPHAFPLLPNMLVLRQVEYAQLPHYLAAADLCLCLYHAPRRHSWGFYNSPLKLFDCMAAQRPVIASRLGQIAEIIDHDHNGILIDDSVEQLTDAIRTLKADPHRCQRLGRAARQTIRAGYTWQHTADRIERLLLSVCEPQ